MSKKEKLLAAAQKNLLKGQIGKAIKDYEKIVAIDANDIRNRQKLAELYSRDKMAEMALATYESVAKHYEDNGFFLKALAVYKQMQKVDASKPELYQRLAEINVKQGLVGNALTEYHNLLKLYRSQGETDEALKILDQMKELDPDNLNISLQVAEAYSQAQQTEKAADCLVEILQRITPVADLQAVENVQKVILSKCPATDCPEFNPVMVELARAFLACGQADRSVELLQSVLENDSQNTEALLSLAKSYRSLADHSKEISTFGSLLELDADNLNWHKGYACALLADGQTEQALGELEKLKEGFFAEGRAADLKESYETIAEQLPENEKAVVSLQAIYEQTGEGGKLFDLMSTQPDEAPATESIAEDETADSVEPTSFGELDLEDEPTTAPDNLEQSSSFEVEADSPVEVEAAQESGLEFDELDLDGIEFGLDTECSDDASTSADTLLDGDLPESPVEVAIDAAGEVEEAEFYFQQGLLTEAAQKCQALIDRLGDCPQAKQLLDRIGKNDVTGLDAGQDKKVVATAPSGAKGPLQGLEDRERSRLDGSLSDFKKGLENQVSAEDFETHYNLGIAYKEMGLLDDAIEQFDKVMADPQRRIDCLTLKGACLVQKEAFEDAVSAFKEGLAYDALKDGERISLYYELGLLYMEWKQPLEALDSFQCVADADPFFRNVDDQIRQLRKELGLDDDSGGNPSGNGSDKNRVSYI
ncbi:tetratricopeptide repeat protein [Syntrophotalea acetylenivorans]|uniref:tetratricopeptide repeat protein n=1 Tax=Syntrophotalea acetylenivorans TaxID=1842532 RepID=UPI000B180988|nr:tetratricopeptide repeat protein [Syntrophotalea acetylenivorans]